MAVRPDRHPRADDRRSNRPVLGAARGAELLRLERVVMHAALVDDADLAAAAGERAGERRLLGRLEGADPLEASARLVSLVDEDGDHSPTTA